MNISNFLDVFYKSGNISTLGGIPLEVISEKNINSTMTVPTKRVENGFNISDSLRKDPLLIEITVVDNSNDYLLNRKALYELQEKRKVVDFYYSGRDTYDNMVVENITEIESKAQYQGFTYQISLRQIQIAEISKSDVKLDSAKADTSGGNKKITTSKVSKASAKDKSKVDEVIKREPTVLKGLLGGGQ